MIEILRCPGRSHRSRCQFWRVLNTRKLEQRLPTGPLTRVPKSMIDEDPTNTLQDPPHVTKQRSLQTAIETFPRSKAWLRAQRVQLLSGESLTDVEMSAVSFPEHLAFGKRGVTHGGRARLQYPSGCQHPSSSRELHPFETTARVHTQPQRFPCTEFKMEGALFTSLIKQRCAIGIARDITSSMAHAPPLPDPPWVVIPIFARRRWLASSIFNVDFVECAILAF